MLKDYLVILAVAAFIRNEKGNILIVKKSSEEKVDGGLWAVPGGKINPQENIIDGLIREVQEEVGLEVSYCKWVGEDVFESGGQWYHGEHFICSVADTTHVVLENKLLEYKWITKEEINSHEFHPNIKKRLLYITQS